MTGRYKNNTHIESKGQFKINKCHKKLICSSAQQRLRKTLHRHLYSLAVDLLYFKVRPDIPS